MGLTRRPGDDFQRVGINTAYATNIPRDFDRQLFFGVIGDHTAQADHAILGIDFDVQSIKVTAVDQTGFNLAGNPEIADHFAGVSCARLDRKSTRLNSSH